MDKGGIAHPFIGEAQFSLAIDLYIHIITTSLHMHMVKYLQYHAWHKLTGKLIKAHVDLPCK